MLSIDIVGLTGACSYALDCIEAELVNIKNKHGKRVAYISIRMAEYWKIQGDELQDLALQDGRDRHLFSYLHGNLSFNIS